MIRRRRNLRDYVNNENGERQRDFSKKEIRVYAYYLFHIFEYFKKKLRINGDDGLYHSFIKLLHHLIIRSDVNDSVSAYLIQTISKAEEAKKLIPKGRRICFKGKLLPNREFTFSIKKSKYL